MVDRGYSEFAWFVSLCDSGVYFVTRRRANSVYEVIETLAVSAGDGIVSDIVRFTVRRRSRPARPSCASSPSPRDRQALRVPAPGGQHHCRSRPWQIELFFKFLKQNLKLKGFYGTSRNAVLTQIWIALCMALMVAYLKFRSATGLSCQQILRLLDINLFLHRDLLDLLLGKPSDPYRHPDQAVLAL